MPECRHCPDGHDNPRSKPWGVHVASTRDGDDQPTTLHVAPSNGSHVAESDADWLRSLIKGDAANAAAIIGEVLAPLHARLAATEFELAEAVQRHRDAEAAVEQARAEEAERALAEAREEIEEDARVMRAWRRREAQAVARAEEAEAAIARVRDVHRVHRCATDRHLLARTPTPCVNDDFCGCGRRAPCPTIQALDASGDDPC